MEMTYEERVLYEKHINYYTALVYNIIAIIYIVVSTFGFVNGGEYDWLMPTLLMCCCHYYLRLAYS